MRLEGIESYICFRSQKQHNTNRLCQESCGIPGSRKRIINTARCAVLGFPRAAGSSRRSFTPRRTMSKINHQGIRASSYHLLLSISPTHCLYPPFGDEGPASITGDRRFRSLETRSASVLASQPRPVPRGLECPSIRKCDRPSDF